jgi:N-acetylornithine carbamoyltransferase
MKTESFKGRDFLAETDFTPEEIKTVLHVAQELKSDRAKGKFHDDLLRSKTLFMIFYNQSLRTRNSFEAGMTQLGGHAHYLDPDKIYTPAMEGREVAYSTERVSDVARVLDRMGDAIAIRCYGDPVDWEYGGAHKMLREFARWADIPVLNMEDDVYHPFQGLADVLTVKEKFGDFKGVNFTMSWAYSPSVHKPRAVPQSAILYASMMGMNVTLAIHKGWSGPDILAQCEYAQTTGGLRVTNDFRRRSGARGLSQGLVPRRSSNRPWADRSQEDPGISTNTRLDLHREIMDWRQRTPSTCTACPATRLRGANDVIDKTSGKDGYQRSSTSENRLRAEAVMTLVMRNKEGYWDSAQLPSQRIILI